MLVGTPSVDTHYFARLKATDILDYEMALGTGSEHSQTQQDKVASATGGMLAPRLDKLIRQGGATCTDDMRILVRKARRCY